MNTKSYTIVRSEDNGDYCIMETKALWRRSTIDGTQQIVHPLEITCVDSDIETYEDAERQLRMWYTM